ncbi:MAG TPA: S-adenosylmethionine:tRNA ribosyltransferase-isomerase [Acidimicrobiales bacterium]|nr:S-adenosylmethionine:tRNA ribosyltransferase-isomerase [Acidimicrobiales bacterium]
MSRSALADEQQVLGDPLEFKLPQSLEASTPPELEGRARDGVRLMVARRGSQELVHMRFYELPDILRPGDLLVVNTSATLPAALDGKVNDEPAAIHLSGPMSEPVHHAMSEPVHRAVSEPFLGPFDRAGPRRIGASSRDFDQKARDVAQNSSPGAQKSEDAAQKRWLVELRHRGDLETTPWLDARPGTEITLDGGGSARLVRPGMTARSSEQRSTRLWEAELSVGSPVLEYLAQHGHPIRYGYARMGLSIDSYQTVFADEPGSAEMPSAARPFTADLVARLVSRGVGIAPISLHTGVSSPEAHEPPIPEWFKVSAETAARVNATRRLGRWVIAVGTTSVRALESASDERGLVLAAQGRTDLVIGPKHPVRVADGMITGWHEPGASHLAMLSAVAGSQLLESSYREALAKGYLWHEFGDSQLIVP